MDELKIAVPRPKKPKPRPAPHVCPPPVPGAAGPVEPKADEASAKAPTFTSRWKRARREALEALTQQTKATPPDPGYFIDPPDGLAGDARTLTPAPSPPSHDESDEDFFAGTRQGRRKAPATVSDLDGPKTELLRPEEPEADEALAEEASAVVSATVELDLAEIKTIPASLYQDQGRPPEPVEVVAAWEPDSAPDQDEGPLTVGGGESIRPGNDLQPRTVGEGDSPTVRPAFEAPPLLAEAPVAEAEEALAAGEISLEPDRDDEESRAEEAGPVPLTSPARPEDTLRRPLKAPRQQRKSRVRAALDSSALLRWGLVAGLAGLLAVGLGLGWSYFSRPATPRAKVARIPVANLPKVPPLTPGFYEVYARQRESAFQTEATIGQGSGLGQALEAVGLGASQRAAAIIECLTKDGSVNPNAVRAGVTLKAYWTDRGRNELRRLEYHPESGAAPLVVMPRADGGFWLYNTASPLLTLSAAREGRVESSLWQAGSDAGLDASVILSLSDILASDVDFFNDIKQGDTFQVLYSRDYRDGRPQGAPVIDMVKLVNKGRSYEYYRFVGPNDKVAYYDPEGRTSHKTFFVTPLQYKRISSNFTMKRLHPIHRVVRPHQGVDYAAPAGTPVSAVADGTVIFADWNGGYGRLITIKHDDTYTTMYAHLSRFAPGITKGAKVKQGDLIGHVGATGTATGPHLDFRLKKNGVFMDPVPELAKQEGRKLEPVDFNDLTKVIGLARDRMKEQLAAISSGV